MDLQPHQGKNKMKIYAILLIAITTFFPMIVNANPPPGFIMPSPSVAITGKIDTKSYNTGDIIFSVTVCHDLESNIVAEDKYTGLKIKLRAFDELDAQVTKDKNIMKVLRILRKWEADEVGADTASKIYDGELEISIKGNMEISGNIFCTTQELS